MPTLDLRGPALPAFLTPDGYFASASRHDSAWSDLLMALFIPRGSVPNARSLGSVLESLIFEPTDDVLALVEFAIRDAVDEVCPHINIDAVDVQRGVDLPVGIDYVPSTGTVYLVGGGPSEGDTITLSDGTLKLVFEFDSNGITQSGHIPVPLYSGNPISTASALSSSISASALKMTAKATNNAVALITTASGPDVNTPIITTSSGIKVSGMVGGTSTWLNTGSVVGVNIAFSLRNENAMPQIRPIYVSKRFIVVPRLQQPLPSSGGGGPTVSAFSFIPFPEEEEN